MDVFATYDEAASHLDDPKQFWSEIDDILRVDEEQDDREGESSNGISYKAPVVDAALLQARLTSFLALCDACYDAHLDVSTNCDEVLSRLIESSLFAHATTSDISNALIAMVTSVRSIPTLHLLFGTLLQLGSKEPELYRSKMAATQLIPRLVHHFWAARYAEQYLVQEGGRKEGNGVEGGHSLDWNVKHVRAISMGDAKKQKDQMRDRKLQCRIRDESVTLLYEVCRAQRLEPSDMRSVDATFVNHLFDLVEASRHYHDDTYNYELIKLIVALNEQFMVSGIESATVKSANPKKGSASQSNIVMTVLRTRLNASNTFGENIIWMLNRASSLSAEDVCMQLLVLKLLYLLFTTKETAHYFYTNDLKVLVDVFIRELSDLPEESESLRHTYLRVLHPLLTNTQLLTYPYKRTQIRRLLLGLTSHAHLRDISPTTKRLVDRCLNAQWCVDLVTTESGKPSDSKDGEEETHTLAVQSIAGGPKTFVQAQTVTDAEGILIPMQYHEPYQGAPSSISSTFAIAAACPSNHILGQVGASTATEMITDTLQKGSLRIPKSREKRGNSISSILTASEDDPSQPAEREEGMAKDSERDSRLANIDTTSRREASASSTLTVRRDLGQRASSARSAPISKLIPNRPSSVALQRANSDEVDTDEESASKWSEGSVSNSWQLGMAGGPHPSRHSTSNFHQPDQIRYGSPLSQDSTEHYFTLTASPIDQDLPQSDAKKIFEAPTLQVEQVLEEEGILVKRGHSSSSSSNGSVGQGMRRRPPAPPMSDGGLGSRKERRAMLSSTSETNLPSSSSNLATKKEQVSRTSMMDMVSLPNSPRSGSLESSREPSPTLDNLPSSRRRRPPPPPVNRATKGVRTPSQQMQLTQSDMTAQRSEKSNLYQEQQRESYQTNEGGGAEAEDQDLDRAMDYLYVSEGGYGW